MNNPNPSFKTFVTVMFKVIWLPLLIFLLLTILFGCGKNDYQVTKTEYHVIDSVWVVPPGHESTMQFDPMYCYIKDNKVVKTRQRLKAGDTVWYKWLKRVEKDSGPN